MARVLGEGFIQFFTRTQAENGNKDLMKNIPITTEDIEFLMKS